MKMLSSSQSRFWVLCFSFLVTNSCGLMSPRREKWIIPANYRGWLRIDYEIVGAPRLPIEGGAYVIRMPRSGRLKTSSPYSESLEYNEYLVPAEQGFRKLGFSEIREAREEPPIEGYAVQQAFGFYTMHNKKMENPGKCVFVGTDFELRDGGGDCQSWKLGESEPPKFPGHEVLREFDNELKH